MSLVDVMQGHGSGFCATGVGAPVVVVSFDPGVCGNVGSGHVWCDAWCTGA